MSFSELTNRDTLRASCAPARLGIATSFLVAFLTILGFGNLAFGEIVASLQSISGVSGVSSDSESYSIADINANGGIVIGDILFDSFSVTSSSLNAVAPTAASIQITGVDIDGAYGFQVNAAWTASGGQSVDTTITFHASVLPTAVAQGKAFDGNALYMTAVDGANTTGGNASISERLFAAYPGLGGSSFAHEFTYYTTDADESLGGEAKFAPVTGMWVKKDIAVTGGVGPGGVMHLSEFYETFQAPEPSALALLAIGAVGPLGYLWRRRSR